MAATELLFNGNFTGTSYADFLPGTCRHQLAVESLIGRTDRSELGIFVQGCVQISNG